LFALPLVFTNHFGRVFAHGHGELILVVRRSVDLLVDLHITAVVALQASEENGVGRGLRCLITEFGDSRIFNTNVIKNLQEISIAKLKLKPWNTLKTVSFR